jgi:hypothetical protein
VSSRRSSDSGAIDLERDVPTSPDDIEALRRLRSESRSWFSLTPEQIEKLLPGGALARRPAERGDLEPFTLP